MIFGSDSHLVFTSLLRWLDLVGVVGLIGAIAFRRITLARAVARSTVEESAMATALSGPMERKFTLFLVPYLLFVALLFLIHESVMLTGGVSLSTAKTLLLRTHVGRVWVLKIFALLAMALSARRGGRLLPLVFAGLLVLSESLSGHPVARGILSTSVLSDFLHLGGVSLWIGGLWPLKATISAAGPRFTRIQLQEFSKIAVGSVLILFAAGLASLFEMVGSWSRLVGSLYGRVLIWKVALAVCTVGIGGAIRFLLLRKIEQEGTRNRVSLVLRLEILLALAVFFLAAVLTQSPPPRRFP